MEEAWNQEMWKWSAQGGDETGCWEDKEGEEERHENKKVEHMDGRQNDSLSLVETLIGISSPYEM